MVLSKHLTFNKVFCSNSGHCFEMRPQNKLLLKISLLRYLVENLVSSRLFLQIFVANARIFKHN